MLPAMQNKMGLASALQETKVQVSSGGDELFCKFDYKTGDFLMGKEAENILDETVLIHTDSIAHGWVLWSGGKPTKTMVNFTQDLPQAPEPVHTGKIDPRTKQEIIDYPSEARGVMFVTDDGYQVILEGSSYGIRQGVDNLLMLIKQQAIDPANADYLYPKVKLEHTSYTHSSGSLIHNPVFTVVEWCDVNGDAQGVTPKLKSVPKEEVVEEAVAEEEPKATAGKRRTRRK